jgi:Fe2+ or Zn2+ uptake regulation protein
MMRRRTRNTQQRRAVLEAVQTLDSQHPTAADVFEAVRQTQPRLSLATVYRSLEALCSQGELAQLKVENVTRFCVGASPHHHIVCKRCSAVTDVCTDVFPIAAIRHLEECSGFSVDLGPVQFFGVCPKCQAELKTVTDD